jgi:hypothetical protein
MRKPEAMAILTSEAYKSLPLIDTVIPLLSALFKVIKTKLPLRLSETVKIIYLSLF